MEAIQAEDSRLMTAKATSVTLGVKAKLTNQEMDLLRQQLARATAYDHTPQDNALARQQRIKRPPQFVKASKSGIYDREIPAMPASSKPAKKSAAAIHHTVEKLNQSEPMYVPRQTKGINQLDKDRLQDLYTVKPRKLRWATSPTVVTPAHAAAFDVHARSTVPLSLMDTAAIDDLDDNGHFKSGKRLGPEHIPQVFLL
ncbi:hypothetical protein H310_07346 [Aphanomyces invadans]|uniref:Uncharacterized protein n=1 Tax=Aphanomyces invadans TaxID=157072 RepID=A0A024U321_9STRA|nr:hypothetical protein H310_07346 [Aphanomyces invadans]ETW00816.1 hypothetical protein H310_07346 [Aphanomyces invadans]|eukprot:XP_008870951.1 hypothetical protein H310_07346 [Aphanomyces invadans]